MTLKRPGAARCLATDIHVSSDRHSDNENLLGGRAGCTRFFTLIIISGMVDADKYISCNHYFLNEKSPRLMSSATLEMIL